MNRDEIIYALFLILSIPFGVLMRSVDGYRQKQIFSSGFGILMVLVVCRLDGLHSLITALVNSLIIILVGPKKCHIVSFIWCFGYIVFFRSCHFIGFPKVLPHSNAIQLILTLKLVGLAFEVHDTYMNKKAVKKGDADEKTQLEGEYRNVEPSFLDMMFYSYCYIGLLTGPYYKYRVYHDMLTRPERSHLSVIPHVQYLIKQIPLIGLSYIIISHYIYIDYAKSDEFHEHGFWYRFGFMVLMFTVFRFRMYSAWLLSECVCVMAGLGAYPKASKPKYGQGPADLKALKDSESRELVTEEYDFETMHNIDMWGCEFSCTVRRAMRSWNMSVQYWLATFIYRRFPNKAWRTSVTMFVSSFWHGIHPGYYLSFMTIPMALMAEDSMDAAFKPEEGSQWSNAYHYWGMFWTMRFLDYMAMGFLLLSWQETMRYWSSIYFSIHLVIITFIILGTVCKTKKPHQAKSPAASSTPGVKKDQ